MSRADYVEARRVAREMRPTREDRCLPHHPDGTGRALCAECEGAGELTHNDDPLRDPQCEFETPCGTCYGRGWVDDGHRDPIRDLAEARRQCLSRRPLASHCYGRLRQRVVSPVCLPADRPTPKPTTWPLAA